MTDDRYALALVRHIVVQAARDGEVQLSDKSDSELRHRIQSLLQDLAEPEWQAAVQSEHQPKLIRAALRFIEEDEPELAIVMYATAFEHWLNGMLEVGLKRHGKRLEAATERGRLEHKVATRWRDLFGTDFPHDLHRSIQRLTRARNDFVHYKWPMHSEQEHDAHRAEAATIARDAPAIFVDLKNLEDSIVFNGERRRLDRVLDEMGLLDVARDQ